MERGARAGAPRSASTQADRCRFSASRRSSWEQANVEQPCLVPRAYCPHLDPNVVATGRWAGELAVCRAPRVYCVDVQVLDIKCAFTCTTQWTCAVAMGPHRHRFSTDMLPTVSVVGCEHAMQQRESFITLAQPSQRCGARPGSKFARFCEQRARCEKSESELKVRVGVRVRVRVRVRDRVRSRGQV